MILRTCYPFTGLARPEITDSNRTSALLGTFRGNLHVTLIPNTRIIEIHYTSTDPQLAASAVNTLAATYVEQNFKTKFESTMQASLLRLYRDPGTQLSRFQSSDPGKRRPVLRSLRHRRLRPATGIAVPPRGSPAQLDRGTQTGDRGIVIDIRVTAWLGG
jgi:hypothetical protein